MNSSFKHFILILFIALTTPPLWAKTSEVKWEMLAGYNLEKQKASKPLQKVLGKTVMISGFMMPLDFSAKEIKEFLLMPYIPSCSHVPPPPNNQIVHVKMKSKAGIKPSYYPVQVTGKLKLDKKKKADPNSFMPEGVFLMDGTKIKELKN